MTADHPNKPPRPKPSKPSPVADQSSAHAASRADERAAERASFLRLRLRQRAERCAALREKQAELKRDARSAGKAESAGGVDLCEWLLDLTELALGERQSIPMAPATAPNAPIPIDGGTDAANPLAETTDAAPKVAGAMCETPEERAARTGLRQGRATPRAKRPSLDRGDGAAALPEALEGLIEDWKKRAAGARLRSDARTDARLAESERAEAHFLEMCARELGGVMEGARGEHTTGAETPTATAHPALKTEEMYTLSLHGGIKYYETQAERYEREAPEIVRGKIYRTTAEWLKELQRRRAADIRCDEMD